MGLVVVVVDLVVKRVVVDGVVDLLVVIFIVVVLVVVGGSNLVGAGINDWDKVFKKFEVQSDLGAVVEPEADDPVRAQFLI